MAIEVAGDTGALVGTRVNPTVMESHLMHLEEIQDRLLSIHHRLYSMRERIAGNNPDLEAQKKEPVLADSVSARCDTMSGGINNAISLIEISLNSIEMFV